MKIAIISDIHANLEALEQTLAIIHERAVDTIVCLGDIVGYGANPNECLERVRQTAAYILLGNHDQAAVDFSSAESFTPLALASARWTHDHITPEAKHFIATLPYTHTLDDILFTHSSPYQPEEWHYILTSADARDNFNHFHQSVCFIGHSHVAGTFSKPPGQRGQGQLERNGKYIINVGSVGQPRDGDWRLSFGIFDTEMWNYENIRAEYDVQTASAKILKAGLPRQLGERILMGR